MITDDCCTLVILYAVFVHSLAVMGVKKGGDFILSTEIDETRHAIMHNVCIYLVIDYTAHGGGWFTDVYNVTLKFDNVLAFLCIMMDGVETIAV